MSQEKKRDLKKVTRRDETSAVPNPEVLEKGKKMKENIDKLLDEIDEVLEENAEEFVKNYVQKGGE
ncbi:MAG: ubiquitin-like protein Pup [Nitrospiria bacterium]